MTEKKVALKPYPYHDGTPNENAAVRSIALVKPECPMDSRPEILGRDGVARPNPSYTGEENCQMKYKLNGQGVWDVEKCIELGHDPYYYTQRRTVLEEVTDDEGYVIESKTRIVKKRMLNVIRATDNIRVSSKMEVALFLARGCKFLSEFGYESPCEFRNCSGKQLVNTQYGKYCSERHARLIAADARHIVLPIGGDVMSNEQALDEKERALESLNISKVG